jgi:hypothetical protein
VPSFDKISRKCEKLTNRQTTTNKGRPEKLNWAKKKSYFQIASLCKFPVKRKAKKRLIYCVHFMKSYYQVSNSRNSCVSSKFDTFLYLQWDVVSFVIRFLEMIGYQLHFSVYISLQEYTTSCSLYKRCNSYWLYAWAQKCLKYRMITINSVNHYMTNKTLKYKCWPTFLNLVMK